MKPDRIFVTGGHGLLGTAIGRILSEHTSVFVARPGSRDLDITQTEAVRALIKQFQPSVVINCAANTKVDDCEQNRELADRVNGDGAGIVAKAASSVGARFIHLSTDYVFSGDATQPYQENHPTGSPDELSAYGRSKLLGERRVRVACPDAVIVRTGWLYGPDGPCFPKTILKAAREKPELRVVNDQTGAPTYSLDLARALLRLAESPARGVVHVTNAGQCTWYEFTCELIRLAGLGVRVVPVKTEEFPRPARRPKYSVLDNSRYVQLTGTPMRNWREAAADYMREYGG